MILTSSMMSGSAVIPEVCDRESVQLHSDSLLDGAGNVLQVVPTTTRAAFEGWIDWHSLPAGYRSSGLDGLTRFLDRSGESAARSLRGDFVLAHSSTDADYIYLYRGLTSFISLFWTFDGKTLSWSVDPLDLIQNEPALGDIDPTALPVMLAEYGMAPTRSVFKNVYRLPPGHRLTWRLAAHYAPRVDSFDEFSKLSGRPGSARDAAEESRVRLSGATRSMLSDASAAIVMLSGGLDSSIAAAEASQACPSIQNVHLTLRGFAGFDADEASACSVAEHTGTQLHIYDLGKHLGAGGDYLEKHLKFGVPMTHVPVNGFAVVAREATAIGARFVVSGLLSDDLLLPDWRDEETFGHSISLLNPFTMGRPLSQILRKSGKNMFHGKTARLASWGPAFKFLMAALRGDPLLSTPNGDLLGKHLGLSTHATRILHEAIEAAAQRSAFEGSSTGRTSFRDAFDLNHVHAAYLSDLRPRKLFLASPFTNRDVAEYLMSMPIEYRVSASHGTKIHKLILRYAYSNGQIPHPVAWRTSQARLDAIPATFVLNNYQRCGDLLSNKSTLAQMGILRQDFMAQWNEATIHRGADQMARLMAVESWLREFR